MDVLTLKSKVERWCNGDCASAACLLSRLSVEEVVRWKLTEAC